MGYVRVDCTMCPIVTHCNVYCSTGKRRARRWSKGTYCSVFINKLFIITSSPFDTPSVPSHSNMQTPAARRLASLSSHLCPSALGSAQINCQDADWNVRSESSPLGFSGSRALSSKASTEDSQEFWKNPGTYQYWMPIQTRWSVRQSFWWIIVPSILHFSSTVCVAWLTYCLLFPDSIQDNDQYGHMNK